MKALLVIFIQILSVLVGTAQTYELYNGDTINRTDKDNKKHGLWIRYYEDKKTKRTEGVYVNNNKQGVWKKYYANGICQSEISYVNNRTDGLAKIYYEDGTISEEGLWKGDKWIGNYKFYYHNGNVAHDWTYNETGERTGVQKYYHENGNPLLIGSWVEGKKSGQVREFYDDGSVKEESYYNQDKIDVGRTKQYNPAEFKPTDVLTKNQVSSRENKSNEMGYFTGTGFFKLHNKNKQIEQEGTFQNGRLIEGKKYIYDNTGKLQKTIIIKDGRAINDNDE